ncbi:MAG: zinc ribbon domain-containing protein [Actinomycetota bacterium]
MDASPQQLLELVELQKVDSAIDRLNSRRRNLSEQHDLEILEDKLAAAEGEAGEQRVVFQEASGRQKRLENEIETLDLKIAMELRRLNSGDVANPRELSALSAEVEALRRRKSKLEDNQLEVMEEAEGVEKAMAGLDSEIESLAQQVEEAVVKRDQANLELASELEAAQPRREHWAARIAPDLLRFYTELRGTKGGVGAAMLQGSTCLGCHMQLPAQEVERLRRTPGVLKCDECGRILVVAGRA